MKIHTMKILLFTFLFTAIANVALGITLETHAEYKYPMATTFINTKLGRSYFVQCYPQTSSSIMCDFNESEIHHTGQTDDTCSISSLHFKHVFNYDTQNNTWIHQERSNPCGERPIFYLALEKNSSIWNYVTKYVPVDASTNTKNVLVCDNRNKISTNMFIEPSIDKPDTYRIMMNCKYVNLS